MSDSAPAPSPASSSAKDRYAVGIVGAGNISDAYIRGCRGFGILEVAAVADLDLERARAKAERHGVARAASVDELLADDGIDIVVNLTIPSAHAEVSLRALEAGKHVYSEKTLATDRADGQRLLDAAAARGLRIGCAPDTFLGGGIQTCRQLVDEGAIGEPLSATALLMGRGAEDWHPNPFFFFQPGGDPMFDMGPYYLTALVNLLGPVAAVAASATTGIPERTVTSQPHAGATIAVEIPTHIMALLEFASGGVANLITSSEVWFSDANQQIEVSGTEGTLVVPDPNTFGGPVRLRRGGDADWREIPVGRPYTDNRRGLGVADMAHALRSGRPHRASGELAYHVLDVAQAIHESAAARRTLDVGSRAARPAPFPTGMPEGVLDD